MSAAETLTIPEIVEIIKQAELEYFAHGAFYNKDVKQGIVNHIIYRVENRFNKEDANGQD